MRQRIKVAQGIVHDPQVLVLDEPLNGLDPVGRREMAELMESFAREGRCVLVSSHILHEVEQLTENILLIQRARLLAQGSIHGIRDLMDRHPHHIAITTGDDRARALGTHLLALPSVLGVRFDPKQANRLEIETNQPDRFYAQLPELVLAGDWAIESFHSPDNNLESVFRYLLNA
jgi:ABC-2 type transport system ATP-binding protein